jgi:3'5'-cyclic nucleotide phosphodiesterase
MDKDLNKLRNAKWEKAFGDSTVADFSDVCQDNIVNRRATIVIEYIIQASDIAHTMQHWQVYRRWNERLFEEMYTAYLEGRSNKDPSELWYVGELWFFDHYIIPLTKKLRDCGVFGVSSDEYMNYALKNREEWEMKGQEVVAIMVERLSCTDIQSST